MKKTNTKARGAAFFALADLQPAVWFERSLGSLEDSLGALQERLGAFRRGSGLDAVKGILGANIFLGILFVERFLENQRVASPGS